MPFRTTCKCDFAGHEVFLFLIFNSVSYPIYSTINSGNLTSCCFILKHFVTGEMIGLWNGVTHQFASMDCVYGWIVRLLYKTSLYSLLCVTPWFVLGLLLKLQTTIIHYSKSGQSSQSATGFYYEVLANGHFVPGESRGDTCRYKQKPVWQGILKVTETACMYYFDRVHLNFNLSTQRAKLNKVKALALRFGVMILDAS